jgi:DNA-binding CsgD family transcriptional regulator
MARHVSPSNETDCGGLPLLISDQEAVLIGRVDTDDSSDHLAAYYIHWRGGIYVGIYGERKFTPSYAIDCESQLMAANAQKFATLTPDAELSSIGRALVKAWHLAELTPLGAKEAHVYALRKLAECSRQQTAAILNIAPSTVDTHLQNAKQKRQAAANLLEVAAHAEAETQECSDGVEESTATIIDILERVDTYQKAF